MTREHAYTALSRGRHGNDLFVVAEDRRSEERHAAEIDIDPLDDSAARSAAAPASTWHSTTSNRTRRAARPAPTRARHPPPALGDGPPTRPGTTAASRRITHGKSTTEKEHSGGSTPHASPSTTSAPSAATTHRAERRELERRVAGFETDIPRHDEKLADLEAKLAELTPEMRIRATWEREHSTELQRLDALDRQITWNEGIERVVTRELERGLELGRGIGHGIEL